MRSSRILDPSKRPTIRMATVQGDVADPNTAKLVLAQALERFGRVDTLVNNAGIFMAKPFTAYSQEDYAVLFGNQRHRLLPHDPARHRGG